MRHPVMMLALTLIAAMRATVRGKHAKGGREDEERFFSLTIFCSLFYAAAALGPGALRSCPARPAAATSTPGMGGARLLPRSRPLRTVPLLGPG